FLEGMDLFRLPIADDGSGVATLFYSRRIGAPPRGAPGNRAIVDLPRLTTIYGAAKLSGRISRDTSIGLLQAVTAEETGWAEPADNTDVTGPASQVTNGELDRVVVEPLSSYSMLRLRRDHDSGKASASLAATAVHRFLDGTGVEPELHDRAYAAGTEYRRYFGSANDYSLFLQLNGSYVHGSPAAIDQTQQSSVHYYQRPDAAYLGYDPSRTYLAGYGWQYELAKKGGSWLRGGIAGFGRSPGFEVNDIGFQREADRTLNYGWLLVVDEEPGRYLRKWQVVSNAWEYTSFEPRHLVTGINLFASATSLGYWTIGGGYELDAPSWSIEALRGGPALREDFIHNAWFSLGSDPRRKTTLLFNANNSYIPASGSASFQASGELAMQLRPSLRISLGPSFQHNDQHSQWVATVDGRHILGRITCSTLGVTFRLSYTLSPRLSLQAYAQPFVSVGRYGDYREVADAAAERYRDRFSFYAPNELREVDGRMLVDRNGD
ncbi:MAG: DUF5916 domain-containing protein, partial [Pseudomonadota bacterium]